MLTTGRQFELDIPMLREEHTDSCSPPYCTTEGPSPLVTPSSSIQVAQQEAERQVYVVALSDQERLAAIIRAEGEAEAAELISSALKESGIGLIEVRRIDTAKEIALTLATSRNITYLPTGGGNTNMLLGLNTA